MPNPIKGLAAGFTDLAAHSTSRFSARHVAARTAPSQWSHFAAKASKPLIVASARSFPCAPCTPENKYKSPLNQALGATRSVSTKPPSSEQIARYLPLLEQATENYQDIVEICANNEPNLSDFVGQLLQASSTGKGFKLGNGHTIDRFEQVKKLTNPNLTTYHVIGTEKIKVPGFLNKFRILISIYKADIIKDPGPHNFKLLMGLGKVAESSHYGATPKELRNGLEVIVPSLPEYRGLYATVEKLKLAIEKRYITQPESLVKAIELELMDRGVADNTPYATMAKQMIVSSFNKKNPGFEEELKHLLEPAKPFARPEKLLMYPTDHKGGAYRAALKLNAMADGHPSSPTTVVCFTQKPASRKHSFEIIASPQGNWLERKWDPQTNQFKEQHFAKPDQLSSALKERGVVSILSEPLGLI